MLSSFWIAFWAGLGVMALVGGLAVRIGMRERPWSRGPVVDDDAVRRILETGTLATEEDEPLDLDDIAEQERRFKSETWDEPDEW